MTFNSLQYALFLPVVILGYRRLRGVRSQNLWLLVASYIFYGAWDWRFLSLIWLSTAVDFSVGRLLGQAEDERHRKQLLLVSLAINLGVLATFKYFGFFVGSMAALLGAVGLEPNPPLLDVLLPVGISFYTFQTISYTFDVFRRRLEPTRDLITFATYVAFFPQLVAGPIERARHLLPQLQVERQPIRYPQFASGLLLIGRGLFRKVVIADTAALLANRAFGAPEQVHWLLLVAGVLAFGVQIYGDFAGYTDIARGTARLLGIELVRNFEQPYWSRSVTEFWRRWHISLSNWLRDYLYVPLGGNRRGRVATYRNLMVTMLLGGLWHGAAWTFVAWGAIHGSVLAVERLVGWGQKQVGGVRSGVRWLVTFVVVHVAWVFFRADDFGSAAQVLAGVLSLQGGEMRVEILVLPVVLLLSWLVDVSERRWQGMEAMDRQVLVQPLAVGAMLGLVLVATVLFSGRPEVPFIYFQF